jgi:hypothetical protein
MTADSVHDSPAKEKTLPCKEGTDRSQKGFDAVQIVLDISLHVSSQVIVTQEILLMHAIVSPHKLV